MVLPINRQRLIVVRGPERPGTAALARALAARLPGASVSVRFADLRDGWIVHHRPDPVAETGLAYRLLKLLVISYLKEGFSAVIDAPFVDPDGSEREQELEDLTRLARTFRGVRPAIVTLLTAPDERPALRGRWRHSALESDIEVEGRAGDVEDLADELMQRIATV